MKICFVGDIHAKVKSCHDIIGDIETDKFVCVGDIGIGFKGPPLDLSLLGEKFFFLHGNHDDPDQCVNYPNYLGRYGMIYDCIFFVSGAFSVDAFYRTPGVDWWFKEQLLTHELEEALDLYLEKRPDIVVTHDCPRFLYDFMLQKIFGSDEAPVFENRTATFLDNLFKIHKPKIWIFGHWHAQFDKVIDGTRFVCLDIFEPLTLDITASEANPSEPPQD